nr:Sodium Bile acid symporter family [Streptococcus thermophilus]
MFETLQTIMAPASTIFVLAMMFSTGLSLAVDDFRASLSHWRFHLRLLLVNFLVVPGIMLLFITLALIDAPYATGMLIHATVAGAPLIMALTTMSKNSVAMGATVQLLLMLATVVVVPFLLPVLLGGVEVSAWDLAKPLIVQMLLPLLAGMALFYFAPGVTEKIRPWISKAANMIMLVFLVLSIVAFGSYFSDPQLWFAVIVGLLALTVAFYVGYGTGDDLGERSQLGALGTAQRNTAAGVLIGMSFEDPLVFITLVFINSFMMFVLMFFAKRFGENKGMPLLPSTGGD